MSRTDRDFMSMLRARWAEGKSVCVGLDSGIDRLPDAVSGRSSGQGSSGEDARLAFNRAIVDATADVVCAFKPNPAFYEAQGPAGVATLIDTISYINKVAPDVPVILDAKRGDIGNTNKGYVDYAYDICCADAVTMHPYLGHEALEPFLARSHNGVLVLCRTSNPGAGEFQDLHFDDGTSLYQRVARCVAESWNDNGNCGLVVGATYPEELAEVRSITGDMPFLIPGIGAQGGDLEATVDAARDSNDSGMIINSSRAILFASSGPDFAEAARAETLRLHEQIKAAVTAS